MRYAYEPILEFIRGELTPEELQQLTTHELWTLETTDPVDGLCDDWHFDSFGLEDAVRKTVDALNEEHDHEYRQRIEVGLRPYGLNWDKVYVIQRGDWS